MNDPQLELSREAWESIQGRAPSDREAVYLLLVEKPMTCDEIEVLTGLRHQTASARVNDLKRAHRICDSGVRRKTRSNRNATVWTTDIPGDGQGILFDVPIWQGGGS